MTVRLTTQAALLVAIAGFVSCAGSTTTKQTNPEDNVREEGSYSTKTAIFTDADEASLDVARGLRRDGHFDKAADAFQALHEKASVKPEIREQALFDHAHLAGDPLNPHKDPATAIKLFNQFLKEFPDSDKADRAREQLTALESRSAGSDDLLTPQLCELPITFADSLDMTTFSDSLRYVLRNGVVAYYQKGQTPNWVVDYLWFRLSGSPRRALYTMAEMDSLVSVGVMNDSTNVQTVTYRVGMNSGSYDSLKVRAVAGRPSRPPETLLQAVRKFDEGGAE